MTRYKTLVVSGCSFTNNNGTNPFAWANLLAQQFNLNIVNLAIPGAGNIHIANSIMLELTRGNYDPNTTLVMAMWSSIGRIDWITDRSLSQFKSMYPFDYQYDEYSELTLGGNWWTIAHPTHLQSTLINYSKYQSSESLALQSWLAMQNLQNYLHKKNYDFRCTAFVDIFTDIQGERDAVTVNYRTALSDIGLELDKSSWLDLSGDNYLGNYCRLNNYLWDDGFHPNWQGHQQWTSNILIPELQKGLPL